MSWIIIWQSLARFEGQASLMMSTFSFCNSSWEHTEGGSCDIVHPELIDHGTLEFPYYHWYHFGIMTMDFGWFFFEFLKFSDFSNTNPRKKHPWQGTVRAGYNARFPENFRGINCTAHLRARHRGGQWMNFEVMTSPSNFRLEIFVMAKFVSNMCIYKCI